MSTPEDALKSLRDFLRLPTPSLSDLTFHLSSTLSALHLHRTSIPPASASDGELKAAGRYLPSVQALLVETVLPHFLGVLDAQGEEALRSLFVPPKQAEGIQLRRAVALVSYLTLPAYLNTPKAGQAAVPKKSQEFVVSLLDALAAEYGVDDLYHAVYSSSRGSAGDGEGWRTLQWEDTVRACVGIPSKVGNVVGRWKADGGAGEMPSGLLPRAYFDRMVTNLEGVSYELSQRPNSDVTPLRLVFEKLSSIGLLGPQPSHESTPSPSLLAPLLPPLLAHLHPPPSSPLPPYPPAFLPSIFLPLPSSTLAAFIDSLLSHLSFRLISPPLPLEPDRLDERIKRAVEVLKAIIGEAKPGGEAWEGVVRSVLGGKGKGRLGGHEEREQARNRIVVGWVGLGGLPASKAFVERIVETWTDSKYVKFSLYSQQLSLTHTLVLAISLLPPFSPWLIALSRRVSFILAFQSYLSHPDASIRRLGMLVGEILSELTIQEDGEVPERKAGDEIEELRKRLEVAEDGDGEDLPLPGSTGGGGGGRRLQFKGMWDGDGDGREECRWLRRGLGVRDASAELSDDPESWLLGWTAIPAPHAEPRPAPQPAPRGRPAPHPQNPTKPTKPKPKPKIVMLDPDQEADPLDGYASPSPTSSRAPSPTPEFLEEVAADPSLALDAQQRNKVQRPVYVPQLLALLKEREKPESLEVALQYGEGLVRAKREYGTELAENAVGVALMTMGLNDPFQIEEFEEKRQGLMNALVVCAPKQVAPLLCEQYFNPQFSLQQKSVILTALAMGARELSGLPVPQAPRPTRAIDFPSKVLPVALHNKYISAADVPTLRARESERGQIDQAIDGVRDLILSKGARKGEETVPALAREKRLRVGEPKRPKVTAVNSLTSAYSTTPAPAMSFKNLAAEYFIMPLINRFWQHFQDSSIRESRAITTGQRYRGAGAGMVLSPMSLEKLLMALALMVHAARHASVFLSVICPEALELAATIGARHPPRPPTFSPEDDEHDTSAPGSGAEAQVLSAALELALVCLDAAVELDAGRTLAMDKAALVMAVGEWASGVFEVENEGGEVSAGQGGKREGKVRAEAAGVVVKIGEIGEKWGRFGMGY
ncbi:hypothetical protein IAT38_006790 [Cryptococcus sp. DSM 104549]